MVLYVDEEFAGRVGVINGFYVKGISEGMGKARTA